MKYSIITINYNNKDGLRRTIESVINQTYKDFEYIIIDGGSTDGSVDVIKEYAEKIDYWVSEPDKGIYNAMNKGILQTHGEYLNFMNSGDCFYDNTRLESVFNSGINADIIIGKDYHENPQTGESYSSLLPPNINTFYLYESTFPHQSAFLKNSIIKNNLYDENFRIVSDWKFYFERVLNNDCIIEYINEVISHREDGGICNSQSDLVSKERDVVLNQILPKGLRNDYENLLQLNRTNVSKLLVITNNKFARKFLALCIRIIYRLFK